MCLHRHFCEAVNGAGARKCAEEPSAIKVASADCRAYYTTKQKMFASTDIFARPSMAQAHGSAQRSPRRQRLRQQASAHIIPRSKRCVLAQTFLRGRQWRRRTGVRRRAFGDKGCVSRLPRILYHGAKDVCLHRHFCEAVNGAGARKCAKEPSATKTASAGFCAYYIATY